MVNDEILREFLLETHENLALLDSDLVTLEQHPTEKGTLAQVFRTLHSVKGTAGFMGLEKLQAVAHAAESLLTRLRNGELRFNPPIATALLQVVDAIREILARIEADGNEGTSDYSVLLAEVERIRLGQPTASSFDASSTFIGESKPLPLPAAEAGLMKIEPTALVAGLFESRSHSVVPAASAVGSQTPAAKAGGSQTPAAKAGGSQTPAAKAGGSQTPAASAVGSQMPAASAVGLQTPAAKAGGSESSVVGGNIRVDVGLLDSLMTLVGELVLARNQILQYSVMHEDSEFLGAVQRLNLLTSDLQASVMKTRMQPIGSVLSKFPRVVRDLAVACKKNVVFEMEGQDTELDKTLIEAIRDPLTHLVRNAIDHGIELPHIRAAKGKSPQGSVRMVAYHEGGKVIIEMSDDGAGIDVARVREKALSNKLVTSDEVSRMSNHDIMRLIFAAGFSTADQVTQFSGRGVGMDVVRTNIEKIGGTVEIDSKPGQGTTIRTKIPLTLAIIPALIVVTSDDRFAIPQVNLLELVNLDAEQTVKGIEYIHGIPVYRLRGSLLPLVFLADQLQTGTVRGPGDELNIVVVQADDRPFGLVVDTIRDTEEIVVKPLQPQLKGSGVFAGAAIMGDGQVALVLDVMGLAQRANVLSSIKGLPIDAKQAAQSVVIDDGQSILLFATSAGSQMAIPLSMVSRLEEIPVDTIERFGSVLVTQYHGEILTLLDVSAELARLNGPAQQVNGSAQQVNVADELQPLVGSDGDASHLISVVVCSDQDRSLGLIVGQVVDIVSHHEPARTLTNRQGVAYSGIVYNRVTEFIDVVALLRSATSGAAQTSAEVSS